MAQRQPFSLQQFSVLQTHVSIPTDRTLFRIAQPNEGDGVIMAEAPFLNE